MGSLVNSKCFASNALAADDWFSGKDPSFTAGSTSYLSWFEKVGGVWQIKRQSIASNGTITNLTSSNATVPTFTACDETEQFVDGVTMGWGVALAIFAAWAIKYMRRGM